MNSEITKSAELQEIEISGLVPNPWNPKGREPTPEMLGSIRSKGIITPLLIRPKKGEPGVFEIVAGERRWKGCKEIGLVTAPCIIRNLSDQQAEECCLLENLERQGLTPLEQARAIDRLTKKYDLTTVALSLGISVSTAARRANLLKLSKSWVKSLEAGELEDFGIAHLERIARYSAAEQEELHDDLRFDLTVDELDERLGQRFKSLASAPWSLDDETLVPKAGACSACPKRSSCSPDLFGEVDQKKKPTDNCLDTVCWNGKHSALVKRKEAEAKKENPDLVLIHGTHDSDGVEEDDRDSVIPHWRVTRCAKSTPGAKQALVVDGAGAGQLTWIKGESKSTSSRADSSGPKKKTMKEKEAGLEKRRICHVLLALLSFIEKGGVKLEVSRGLEMVGLIMMFGTERDPEAIDWKEFQALVKGKKLPPAMALWELVVENIESSIRYEATQATEPDPETAREIAKLVGFDMEAAMKKAVEEIKRPASWGEEGKKKPSAKPAKKPAKKSK